MKEPPPVSEPSPSKEETPLETQPTLPPVPAPATEESPSPPGDSPTMEEASMEHGTQTPIAQPMTKGESIDLNQTPLKNKKPPWLKTVVQPLDLTDKVDLE